MNANNECIKVCNSLLRGELSAIETYSQAIEKYSDSPMAKSLSDIRKDHVNSANLLADNVTGMGGEPETDSGAWGVFAKTVQGTANVFGKNTAIESLLKGEESGRSDYEDALKNEAVMPDCKTLIRGTLHPAIVRHISRLHALETLD
jgi:bacterioferritin (cytochrome b1)